MDLEHGRSLFGPGEWNQKLLGPGPIPAPPASFYGLCVLFGCIAVCHVALTCAAKLEGKAPPCTDLLASKHALALDPTSLPSIHALLRESSRFGALLMLCWVAEHRPPYPHLDKIYDRDLYWFVTAQLFLVAFVTIRKVPKNGSDILGREQTEEWKGWMQFSFLMYHYFKAEDTYNAIRVMITCYVWMTGFGNFSFFYIKRDFSAVRLLQMMWRLNFLVVFLCLTFGNTYILYYICPLHTFFFCMVYGVMWVKQDVNHSQWGIRVKLALLALVVYLVWDVAGSHLYDVLFSWWMNDTKTIGATLGAKWEWYFRSSLDHWSTFLGMVFALNYPAAKQWMLVVESLPPQRMWAVKGAAAAPIVGLLWWWYTSVFAQEKPDYNASNAYFGCVPLLGYVFLRNLTPGLRSHYAHSLHELGKVTLETYLLQHHLWLSSNAKTLLRLLPFEEWRACNMLCTTIVYFLASRELYRLTMALRGMLLPDTSVKECLRNLGGLAGVMLVSWVIGFLVKLTCVRNDGLEPGQAVPLMLLLSCAGGGGAYFWLVRNLNNTKPHGGGAFYDKGMATVKAACAATGGVVLVAWLLGQVYFSERPADPTADAAGVYRGFDPIAAAAAAAKPLAQKIPGEMAQPLLGFGMLVISGIMLASMDSYFGIPMLALKLVGGGGSTGEVTYSAAYSALLESIGIGPTLPTEKEPQQQQQQGGDGSGSGENEDENDQKPLLNKDNS